jgi:hypothetical protein
MPSPAVVQSMIETALAVRGIITTGNIFYVDSGHANNGSTANYGASHLSPLDTLAGAFDRCTANNGDIIIVMPGHAETTTAVALDVAGVSIIGLGYGRSRPAFTATTAATDLFNASAANLYIENIRLIGAASGNTALLNVAADDGFCRNVSFEQGATPLAGVTGADGDRWTFEDCQWVTSANGPDFAIDIESSACDFWTVRRCVFNASAGWDNGVIRSNADQILGWLIEDCTFIKCDTFAIDINSSASVSDGVVRNCTFLATAALTSIEDIIDVGGYKFSECYAHDGTNVTTSSARVPIGTVS